MVSVNGGEVQVEEQAVGDLKANMRFKQQLSSTAYPSVTRINPAEPGRVR